METRELGRSGVAVTRFVLGCGNFGGVGSAPAFFGQGISHDVAFRIMDRAWDLGIRAFDTADAYGGGRSESWIGEWLVTKGNDVRDALVIETKTYNPMAEGEDRGLARARILRQIETSLRRLGVERIGLYLAHEFDAGVRPEETLSAFDELVRAGKVGAVGASNFTGDQLAEAIAVSEREGLVRYELVQNSHSLLENRDARTILPVCRRHGVSYQCFGPLAGGWLTGKYRRGEDYPSGSRMTQRPEGYRVFADDRVFTALERLEEEARGHRVSMAGLALAWLLAQHEIAAIVVGPGRPEHLEPMCEALELKLDRTLAAGLAELFA
jgi:aryl-alcohol dehydrogenase-like predicted oxidoreductase